MIITVVFSEAKSEHKRNRLINETRISVLPAASSKDEIVLQEADPGFYYNVEVQMPKDFTI